jgi:hypothetical protein
MGDRYVVLVRVECLDDRVCHGRLDVAPNFYPAAIGV